MKQNWWKLLVVLVLVVAVGVVLAGKNRDAGEKTAVVAESTVDTPVDNTVEDQTQETPEANAEEPEEPVSEPAKAEKAKPEAETKATADVAANPAPKTSNEALKPTPAQETKPKPVATADRKGKQLPKLLDLGASKCIPCKMMAPILEELSKEYKGRLEVVFIDVWENRGESEKYGIQSIPTQIFYDGNGKEFFRHTGFFSKEDILDTFKEQGIDLSK